MSVPPLPGRPRPLPNAFHESVSDGVLGSSRRTGSWRGCDAKAPLAREGAGRSPVQPLPSSRQSGRSADLLFPKLVVATLDCSLPSRSVQDVGERRTTAGAGKPRVVTTHSWLTSPRHLASFDVRPRRAPSTEHLPLLSRVHPPPSRPFESCARTRVTPTLAILPHPPVEPLKDAFPASP